MMAEDTEESTEESTEETTEDVASELQTDEVPAAKKEKKPRKVIRRRKTKKERENVLTVAVRLAVESGKVEFGARTGLVASKAKLFIVAGNTPVPVKDKITGYAKTSNIPLLEFEGSSMELGSVCGKPFPVSVLSIYSEGSSNILEMAKKK
jgi:large subunit ribosomal protein L30e